MLRNIGSNWSLLVLNVGAMYFLTPFIIRTLGNEGYGAWTLLTSLAGYIGLLALGVPLAAVRYIARHLAERDIAKVNATIGSCAGLYLIVGAVALAAAAMLSMVLEPFGIPPWLGPEAWLAFVLLGLHVSAGFIGLLPESIMLAHHDFVVKNAVRSGAILLRVALTLTLLAWRPTLVVLAGIQIACLAFDVAAGVLIIRRRYPAIRISLRDFDRRMLRQIFSFSVFALLMAAGARLTFETDAIVIGAFVGVEAIPFYVIANNLIVYLMDFVIGIAAVVSPMATTLHAAGRLDELRTAFLKWSKVALSLTLMAGLFLIVLGPRFVGWWIDPSFEAPSGQVLQILMVSSFLFLPVRGVALPILMGIGKPQIPAVGYLLSGAAKVGLSIALAGPFGLVGVAVGTAASNAAFAIVLAAFTCRELDVAPWRFAAYVVPRAAVGALPVLALLLWFRVGVGVQGLTGLAAAGFGSLAAFAVTWVAFVYRRDPLVDLVPHLARIRAWSRI